MHPGALLGAWQRQDCLTASEAAAMWPGAAESAIQAAVAAAALAAAGGSVRKGCRVGKRCALVELNI